MNQFISKNEYDNVKNRSCLFILFDKPDNAISLNRSLAEKLSAISPQLRAIRLPQLFAEALDELPDNPVLCEIDILFNPGYKVDVLKILTEADKQKNFTLVWPGTIDGDRLIYGEEGYADYKSYNISNYNIICVI